MISPDEAAIQAEQNFLEGYNCAQSVLLVFASELNLEKSTALRMAQSFGGGTCRLREMCGTVSGMLMALGCAEGSDDPRDKNAKDRLYKIGQSLVKRFSDLHGSFICKELLGLVPVGTSKSFLAREVVSNSGSVVSEERTAEYYKKRPCPKLCADSARIFAEYLNEVYLRSNGHN